MAWNRTSDPSQLVYTRISEYEVAVNQYPNGLEIYIKGYGCANMQRGWGSPIVIDLDAGSTLVPRVVVWGDIEDEEPTAKVPLKGASENE
jgi:hypothetical protein